MRMCAQRQTSPKVNNLSAIVPKINSKDLLSFNTEERGKTEKDRVEGVGRSKDGIIVFEEIIMKHNI